MAEKIKSPWIKHVEAYMKEHPKTKWATAIKRARKTYTPNKKGYKDVNTKSKSPSNPSNKRVKKGVTSN